jgi:2'-5' RNA ligase
MRVIVRFSLNGPSKTATPLRAKLKKALEKRGIRWTGNRRSPHTTSTYEAYSASEQSVEDALEDFWTILVNSSAAGSTAHVDHFWMYADRKPPAKRLILAKKGVKRMR